MLYVALIDRFYQWKRLHCWLWAEYFARFFHPHCWHLALTLGNLLSETKNCECPGLTLGGGGGGCMVTAEIDWCISLLTSKLPNKTVKSCPLLASFCRMKSLIQLNLQCWHPYLFCGFSGKFSKEAKNGKFQTKGEEETRSRAICTRKELCGGREKDSTPRVFSWVNCTVYPGIKLQTPGLVEKDQS